MPALTTITGVAIARVGQWDASTGPWVCTREQLADAVRAQHDPAFRSGVLKIGHDDPRFDGEPAVGRLLNLRLDASGEVLLADLTGVPTWLADVLPSAYPSRSIEAMLGVQTQTGEQYAMVVTGLALLGVTPPAIESLADLASRFDADTSLDAYVMASKVAARLDTPTTEIGAPMPTTVDGVTHTLPTLDNPTDQVTPPAPDPSASAVRASASIDALVAQATAHAMANGADGWVWTREVHTDHVILDDDAGRLYRMDWKEADGTFTFGSLTPVVVTYTPVAASVAARAAHRAHLPLRYERGRVDVIASTPEETPPVSPETAAQVRERLGLAADADDAAVLAAIDSARAGQADPPKDGTPAADATAPVSTPTVPLVTEAPTGAEGAERTVTAALGKQVAELSTQLAEIRAERARTQRDAVIGDAVKAGKIRPADRTVWEAQYDASPEGAKAVGAVFAALAPGTAVPVDTIGTTGAEGADDVDAEYKALYESQKVGG